MYLITKTNDTAWITIGVKDKKIHMKVNKHKSSGTHISRSTEFSMLGKVVIKCHIDSAYHLKIKQSNEHFNKK